jgi:hypothetical protein
MRNRLVPFLVILALALDLRSALARKEVLRSTPSQCLRLEPRVASAELRVLANPTNVRAQARFTRISRKYATRCVHLNEMQVLAMHNAYHIRPAEPLWSALLAFDSMFQQIDYTHPPLDQQFSDYGIRQVELDVWADPNGGKYANRPVLSLFNLPTASGLPEMSQPGFKVMHIADVDFLSTCYTFVECLQVVKAWSDARPWHLPIAIQVEAEDAPTPDPFNLGFQIPIPFDTAVFDALDAEIRSVFAPEQLITPDDVRGSFATLDEAVTTYGWPTLGESRGKIMFLLDNEGGYRDAYLNGHPGLQGRVIFTSAEPGNADAGFIKLNDPVGSNAEILQRVAQGYVVRTRADADTIEARAGDTGPRDAALASGAQWVSTDYPIPDPSFGTGYFVAIPDGHPARCNPINAPAGCRSTALE